MGKKYLTKKMKKLLLERAQKELEENGVYSPSKDKKIAKEPKTKDTVLSDIELQIVDMFSRSFTNGQIGVKYPQQKKKGMMRLMNFCFRTIIEEVELYVGSMLQKEGQNQKSVDKRQRTIFYLSSNYRYKHIQKSLLEDFKIVCKNYVRYHCLQHMDIKFLEKFYKKIIFNDFNADTSALIYKKSKTKYGNSQQIDDLQQNQEKQGEENEEPEQQDPQNIEDLEELEGPEEPEEQYVAPGEYKTETKKIKTPKVRKVPRKYKKSKKAKQTVVVQKKKPGKRGRKKKNWVPQTEAQKQTTVCQTTHKDKQSSQFLTDGHDLKSNKICIQKINIYLGYDSKYMGKRDAYEQDMAKLQAHPYARMEVEQSEHKLAKRKWTHDMEAQLIDQFMNTSATSPNIIIRNLMKKFGRNKLFVENQIQAKRKEMFQISVDKFIRAFDGKTLCSEEAVKKMESNLRSMSLSPKNYYVASFIHDFYFKDVQGISVTLLSEYIYNLNKDVPERREIPVVEIFDEATLQQKKKLLQRQDLKMALDTMSKLVASYDYTLVE